MVSKDSLSVAKPPRLRTPQEARDELFTRTGTSVSSWAVRHGISPQVVFDLLHGRSKGVRGDAHRAAVLMGIKAGELPTPEVAR